MYCVLNALFFGKLQFSHFSRVSVDSEKAQKCSALVLSKWSLAGQTVELMDLAVVVLSRH